MPTTVKTIFLVLAFAVLGLGAGYAARLGLARAAQPQPEITGDFQSVIGPYQTPIVLFATKTCPYCKQARDFFAANDLRFTELDVADPTVAAKFQELGGSGVPMVFSADRRIIGFDPEAFARLKQPSP